MYSNPRETPRWPVKEWAKYWARFPVGWLLTMCMAVFGLTLACYGYVRLWWSTPRKKVHFSSKPRRVNGISIVMPTYNEAENIEETLASLNENCTDRSSMEVVVVDGGSKDGTVAKVQQMAKALELPIRLVADEAVTGRGVCQNVGARHAQYDVLLFVHADTVMEPGYDEVVRQAARDPTVLMGAFTFGINRGTMLGPLVGLGTLEWTTRLRSRWFSLPYGDQAMFFHKTAFDALGRFPDTVMMEDFDLARTARTEAIATGARIHVDAMPCYCSPRRWEKNGVPKNTLLNQIVVICYTMLHYSHQEIYDMYYQRKGIFQLFGRRKK